jgi:hypothetical protein
MRGRTVFNMSIPFTKKKLVMRSMWWPRLINGCYHVVRNDDGTPTQLTIIGDQFTTPTASSSSTPASISPAMTICRGLFTLTIGAL